MAAKDPKLNTVGLNRDSARSKAFEKAGEENDQEMIHRRLSTEGWKSILTFAAVGLGEEAFFRGFLFPAFSQPIGVWSGAFASSTIFAFAHTGAYTQQNIVRTALGLLFCWQYHRNKYVLNNNIFTHAWYDQILIGPFNIAQNDNQSFSWNKMPIGATFTFQF